MHKIGKKAIRRVGLVPCTETGQNEVSKQTTEEVQGANPGLLLFENQKNSWSTMSWSVVQKSKNAHVSSGNMYIIVDQNGLFSWFWCTNFSFLSLWKRYTVPFLWTPGYQQSMAVAENNMCRVFLVCWCVGVGGGTFGWSGRWVL